MNICFRIKNDPKGKGDGVCLRQINAKFLSLTRNVPKHTAGFLLQKSQIISNHRLTGTHVHLRHGHRGGEVRHACR